MRHVQTKQTDAAVLVGLDAPDEAGVAIVGGHSVDDPEPKYGLAVTGIVDPTRVVRVKGARPGCDLALTKPLGMGIISSGIKEGKTSAATIDRAVEVMSSLNRVAAEAMLEFGASAATDVTGFGLMGHLTQMLGDELSAEVDFDAIPLLHEAIDLADQGVLPAGSRRNLDALDERVDTSSLDPARRAVIFDAQTSGGLLIAIEPQQSDALVAALRDRGVEDAARIGRLVEGDGRVRVTRRGG